MRTEWVAIRLQKTSVLIQGGRQSRREECGQIRTKVRLPRVPNPEMENIMKYHGLSEGTKLFETKLHQNVNYEKHYNMLWKFLN